MTRSRPEVMGLALMQIHRDTNVPVAIDAQNDFCPGGGLAVADGDARHSQVSG